MSALPDWALRALEHFKPLPGHKGDAPDPGRLRHWLAFSDRFARRWGDLAPDSWRVPDDHPRYEGLRRGGYMFPPPEYVRQCILEFAIESAWELGANKKPAAVVDAVRELDRLNEKISEAAEVLAKLFRDREQLRVDFGLSDRPAATEEGFPDPFRLMGALEVALTADRQREGFCMGSEELSNFFSVIATSGSTPTPEWPMVLDEVAQRMPRIFTPMDAPDIAVHGSRTNKSPWSPWALRLIARLDDWPGHGLPEGFFLGCLTNEQLATLAEVSCDAPPGAFNAEQMRKLRGRHADRVKVQGRFGAA